MGNQAPPGSAALPGGVVGRLVLSAWKGVGEMRETVLVQRACRGDRAAFNQLVAVHQGIAYSLAAHLLDDRERAEDAVQQSVLRTFQQMNDFQGEGFRCWLLRTVAHICQDWSQDAPRRVRISGERIQQGLSLLPFEQRLALLLSDVYGLSRQESGIVMAASEETVTQMLYSGRVMLRNLLFEQTQPSSGFERRFVQAV